MKGNIIIGNKRLYITSVDNDRIYAIGNADNTKTGLTSNQEKPKHYKLKQNYPNPFNPSTTIQYSIPEVTHVELTVYNLLGQQVAKLVDAKKQAGTYTVTFDPEKLSSGVYLYKLQTESFSTSRKMLLLK